MNFADRAMSFLIPACILLHLALAPYTKVEESFNIQAIHDISTFGLIPNSTTIKNHYDHIDFPGSVPRTFVGAYIMAALSSPLMQKAASPKWNQFIVRATVGAINASALLSLQKSVRKSFGRAAGNWYAMLQASQFHVMFYASRTLPNMLAFALTTLALKAFIRAETQPPMSTASNRRHMISLTLLTIAGVIFRSELAVLVATQAVYLLSIRHVSLTKAVIPAGLMGLAIALPTTVAIDSHFWSEFPTWPEWSSFYYNTLLGKSSDWGTSPWHFYFTNALPRLLFNPLSILVMIPLALYQPATSARAKDIILPELAFVALYSILPHKEWRFVIYIIPGLTTIAAIGAAWIWERRSKSIAFKIASWLSIASIIAAFIDSGVLLAISRLNYPGGHAISRLHSLTKSHHRTHAIFADNLACQTGVTRFLEARGEMIGDQPKYRFQKTENQTALLDPQFWAQFDYVLVEHPERCIGKWEPVEVISAFSGFKLIRPDEGDNPETTTEQLFQDQKENGFEMMIRQKLTRGWWFSLLEPKLTILKRMPS